MLHIRNDVNCSRRSTQEKKRVDADITKVVLTARAFACFRVVTRSQTNFTMKVKYANFANQYS